MPTIALRKAIAEAEDAYGVAHPDAYHRLVRADVDLLALVCHVTVYSYHDEASATGGLSPVRSRTYTAAGDDFTDTFSPTALSGGVDAYTHLYDWLQDPATSADFVGATEVTA